MKGDTSAPPVALIQRSKVSRSHGLMRIAWSNQHSLSRAAADGSPCLADIAYDMHSTRQQGEIIRAHQPDCTIEAQDRTTTRSSSTPLQNGTKANVKGVDLHRRDHDVSQGGRQYNEAEAAPDGAWV